MFYLVVCVCVWGVVCLFLLSHNIFLLVLYFILMNSIIFMKSIINALIPFIRITFYIFASSLLHSGRNPRTVLFCLRCELAL